MALTRITSDGITDAAIVNADINASAAIAGTKISPDFGSQDINGKDIILTDIAPEVRFIDSNGNPDYSLVVNSGQFRIKDETNDAIRFLINSDGHIDLNANVDISSGLDVTGAITGTGDMTIDTNTLHVDSSNNRVGIGTTSPAAKLEIKSSDATYGLKITNDQNSSGSYNGLSIAGYDENSGSYPLVVVSNSITHETGGYPILCCNSRKVGIGTLSPTEELVVRADAPSIQLESSNASGRNYGFQAMNDGKFHAYDGTAGVNRLTIDSSGNVGIGTTSPDHVLDLGSSTAGRNLTFSSYTNLFSEYSSGALWIASNFYGNSGASGYKTGTSGNFGASGIKLNATGGSSNSGLIQFFVDSNSSKSADAAFTPTERMRIDSSGRLLLGTTTEGFSTADDLTIASSTDTGITIRSGTSNQGNIFFADGTSGNAEYRGIIQYTHGTGTGEHLRLFVNAAEKVRIDSDGLKLNGDTAAANALDDYEEGTWTPAYNSGSASSACFALGISYNTGGQTGLYTKIGNVVYFRFNIDAASSGLTAKTGILQINGLPFTPANTTHINSGAAFFMFTNAFGSATLPNAVVLQNSSVIQFYDGNGGIFRGVDLNAPQNAIQMAGMYHTS